MSMLASAAVLDSFGGLIAAFAISTLAYAAFSTMVLNLPADVFPTHSVASVSGMSGTGAGLGTIAATYMIGRVADAQSFEPVLIAASLVPLGAMAAALLLVRNNRATEQGIVNRI
jgi:ACS family hexuronate transporter-like MFS transporter